MKTKILSALILTLLLAVFVSPVFIHAQNSGDGGGINGGDGTGGNPGDGTGGNPGGTTGGLTNPLKDINSIYDLIEKILSNIVLPIGSVVVVILVIYSGFLFVTAQGNESKLETARRNFLYVLIGAAILLGSWAIALAIKGTLCNIVNPGMIPGC